LARQRKEQDADPYLRHYFPEEVDARRVPCHAGGGQETRPPQIRQGVGALHVLAEGGAGASDVAAQGGGTAGETSEFPAERTEEIRLRAGHHAAYRHEGPLRDIGTLRQIRQGFVPAHPDTGRERRVPAQADELPAPLRDIPPQAAFVPRPAAAFCGVRYGVPLRTERRAARADARAGLYAGRRAPLRASRPVAGGVREGHRYRALYLQDAQVRGFHRPGIAARPGEQGEIYRQRRELGEGRAGHHRGGRTQGAEDCRGARRSCILRPEARLHGEGCPRPEVAARYDTGGLQPARTFRPDLHRSRRPAPPSHHDTPGAVRFDGALRGRAARTHRRQVPAVAHAPAGGGAAHQRKIQRLRAECFKIPE